MISEKRVRIKAMVTARLATSPQKVLALARLSTGRMSHRKWWMVLAPWKGNVQMRVQ